MTTPRLGAYKVSLSNELTETVRGQMDVSDHGTLTIHNYRIVSNGPGMSGSLRLTPVRAWAAGAWKAIEEVPTDG